MNKNRAIPMFAAAGTLLAAASFGNGVSAAVPRKAIEVQGHRGARARLPENTLPAFQYAIEQGVDVLELDLGVTRDGKLVINHDQRVNSQLCLDPAGKTIQGDGPLIHSLTLAELKKYDCGSVRNPRFPDQKLVPGTRIPTLEELFDLVARMKHPNARKVRFNIETKIEPEHPENTVGPVEFTKLVMGFLRKRKDVRGRWNLQSFDYRTLDEARKIDPRVKISLLTEDRKEDVVKSVRDHRADILSPDWEMVTPEMVRAVHAAGAQVLPWTPDDEKAWGKLVEMGVDGLITDDPAALIAFLKARHAR